MIGMLVLNASFPMVSKDKQAVIEEMVDLIIENKGAGNDDYAAVVMKDLDAIILGIYTNSDN